MKNNKKNYQTYSLDHRFNDLKSNESFFCRRQIDIQQTTSTIGKDVNKPICNALGCSQYAFKKIIVDIGKFGAISLPLYENCVS
jgi:hypothetical protein